jgi:metal-dependent amidase/aminoacylase/carboxypeptidase family protein
MTGTGLESVTIEEWNAIASEIEDLFAHQWADPELPAMEYRSSARLVNWLAGHGFGQSAREALSGFVLLA